MDLTDEEYDIILAAGKLTPEYQHHGPPGGALFEVPDEMYDMSAGGKVVLVWLSQHMVFFMIGLAGWACYYHLRPSAQRATS